MLEYLRTLNNKTTQLPKYIPRLQGSEKRIVERNIAPTKVQRRRKSELPLTGYNPVGQDKLKKIVRFSNTKSYKW